MFNLKFPLSHTFKRVFPRAANLVAVLFVSIIVLRYGGGVASARGKHPATEVAPASTAELWPISIDYPDNESIFPPGITPPTFLWRDGSASSWSIEIRFADDASAIHAVPRGERMRIGAIDPDCVAATNEPPRLSPQQAASWTWTPDPATWKEIQYHSTGKLATVTITGYNSTHRESSQGHIVFTTSVDPVGAPIFYRDVPLMPSAGANGTVQPLSPDLIHLIRWRLRDIRNPESHTVLTNMPTCANCHSFSSDGKTMGMDVDGPANDKGLYAMVPVQSHMSIENKDVVQWNTDGQAGKVRVGFMSQVSPNGKYVVSTFAGSSTEDVSNMYYVTNFKDYRFLQVFYPTRGILEWYSREMGKRQPLPGADDPTYVQTDGVWSPDGKYIVFARAEAKDPYPPHKSKALRSNDPNETQIQYDLYKIPFNEGRGGTPERIQGASQNGMSNNFPKVSPDGRWIVFVQCRNGQLMRPDSQLYIVPLEGGVARRLRANTSLMNSWHSFSPNGRWLVFSSKARSPYTQMYLTHLDNDGNSSPAILIDNSTASNRAVNLPEFVNIAGDGIENIQVPAVEIYKLMDEAMNLEEKGSNDQALGLWKKAVALDPENAKAQNGLGISLYVQGSRQEAFEHLRQAIRINPLSLESHYALGKFLLEQRHADQALPEFQATISIRQRFTAGEEGLANSYQSLGDYDSALVHWRKAYALEPTRLSTILGLAWLLSTAPEASQRNGREAVSLAESANNLVHGSDPEVLGTFAAAYAENREFTRAVELASSARDLAIRRRDFKMANAIRIQMEIYVSKKSLHESQSADALHRALANTQGGRGGR